MTDALPLLKGSPEALETSMLLILKRVNKMFEKLANKPDLMVRVFQQRPHPTPLCLICYTVQTEIYGHTQLLSNTLYS